MASFAGSIDWPPLGLLAYKLGGRPLGFVPLVTAGPNISGCRRRIAADQLWWIDCAHGCRGISALYKRADHYGDHNINVRPRFDYTTDE